MKQKIFGSTYSSYTKAYSAKNYEQCLELFTEIDLKSNYLNYSEQMVFLLRSASHAFLASKNSNTKYNIAIANGWKDVFSEASRGSAYEKFFSILEYFVTNLEKHVPLISGLLPTVFDLSHWLQALNKHLFQALSNAKIVDDSAQTKRKEIYLQMTQTLLIFVYAEAKQASLLEGRWKFKESRSFLKSCQQFHLFRECEGIQQYNLCFKLLDKFLVALSSEAGDLGQAMDMFLAHLGSLKTNELRATLFQDNYVTLAKMLKACTHRFVKINDSKNATGCFNLIVYVAKLTRQMKSNKPFCMDCDAIGNHCTHEMATLASEIYPTLIEKGIGDDTIEQFAKLILYDFGAVCKLKCAKTQEAQYEATSNFLSLMKNCESKTKAKFIIPVIKYILPHRHRFELMDAVSAKLDHAYLLYKLFNLINTTDERKELIDVGYLLMAFYSAAPNNASGFEQIAWAVAKNQKDNKETITPMDQLKKLTKLESLYGLKLPDNFDLNKLTLEFLKVGFKYNVISPELNNKMVHQLLMMASTKDVKALRFVLSVQSMKFDKISNERVDKLVNSLNAQSKTDMSIALQLAAMKYLRFNFDGTQLQEKYNNISISEALSEAQLALETSIFREVTFDHEKKQIETLRYVKDRFNAFTKFYLNKTVEEQKQFEDEKELLLRELKVVANQFIVRGYSDDGMELYMTLFKLSKALKDEFGLIDACSFFAENCKNFQNKFPHENLQSIIENCFTACVKKLKDLNTLSSRKQTQVCFCLLNLVLYYYEDGGNYQSYIKLILAFIYKTIGGTGDQNIQGTVEALIGQIENKPKPSDGTTKNFSEAIRIKFYSVLFIIITKYGAPSAFHPTKFIQYAMDHVKTYLGVYYENTAAVAILLYNMLPEMVLWLGEHYELNVEIPALMLSMLKLSLKSGYAHRTGSLMVDILQMDLLGEKLNSCKLKLKALEYVMLSDVTDTSENMKFNNNVFSVDETGSLCEPIRKQVSTRSPMKCLSPIQSYGSTTNQSVRFLPKHTNNCECGICFSRQNQFLVFCVAISYARFVYLNDEEFDKRSKQAVFNAVLEYWERCRKEKSFPKNDSFYVASARMLLYDSHFQWKFEENHKKAKDQLGRGLKGLSKVKYDADAMKKDLQHQIDRMHETIELKKMTREEMYAGPNYINRYKVFNDAKNKKNEPMKNHQAVVKNAAKPQTVSKSTPKPPVSLLDMISNKPALTHVNFQIHDDEAAGRAPITPIVKRQTRHLANKVERTPIHKTDEICNMPKTSERPKRATKPNLTPTDFIDLAIGLPPPKRNYRRIPQPAVTIDITSPPDINDENNANSTPETQITSKPPEFSRPRRPKK